MYNKRHDLWGYSSVGRALQWHCKGQEFDPPYLHQELKPDLFRAFLFFSCNHHPHNLNSRKMKGWFYMRKELFTLILLALIPTFSMANVNKKPVKNEVKESKDITTTTDKPKEYSESEVILKKDMSAYTLDGKELTGLVVIIPMQTELYSKMTIPYKDGKIDGARLYYNSKNQVIMKSQIQEDKTLEITGYYTNGKRRFTAWLGPKKHAIAEYPSKDAEDPFVSYARIITLTEPTDNSDYFLVKIYNFQRELVAQISTNKKAPYAKCVLANGNTKKMSQLRTDNGDDILEPLMNNGEESFIDILEMLTDKIKDGQEFKCEYE